MRRGHDPLGLGLGLALLLTALFFPVLFLGRTFVLRDALRFTLPSREFLAHSLAAGRIPQWFDGVGFGVAFAANPVHGALNPAYWPFALLPMPWGVDAHTLLNLFVLALGGALLAKELGAAPEGAFLAGAALTTSGYAISAIPNGNVPCIAWIPWVSWSAIRLTRSGAGDVGRRGAVFAIVTALQLMAGEPGSVLTAALMATVLAVGEAGVVASFRKLWLPALLGLGLSALVTLPAFLHLFASARGAGLSGDPLKWSLHPARLVEFVWPLCFGSEGNDSWFPSLLLQSVHGDPFWSLSLFIGTPVLLLAIAGCRGRLGRRVGVSAGLFLFLATGSFNPVFLLARTFVPPLKLVNFPEKFVFGLVVILACAAGVGFTRLLDAPPARWLLPACATIAALFAALAVVVLVEVPGIDAWLSALPRARMIRIDIAAGVRLAAAGAVASSVGALLLAAAVLARRTSVTRRGLTTSLAALAVLAPAAFVTHAVTPTAPRAAMTETPALVRVLPPSPLAQPGLRPRLFVLPGEHAMLYRNGDELASLLHESLDTNVASRFGLDVLPGFETGDSAVTRRLWDSLANGQPMSFAALTRLCGIDHALLPRPAEMAPGYPITARLADGWGMVATFPVRPRAFVAPRATAVPSRELGIRSLFLPGRESDPARVFVSGTEAADKESPGPLEPCAVSSSRPEELDLLCSAPHGGYAVLLDENVRGWSAQVDGAGAPLLTADGLFRAVALDPGSHRIRFRYRTPGLLSGALVSAVALAVVVLMARAGAHETSYRG